LSASEAPLNWCELVKKIAASAPRDSPTKVNAAIDRMLMFRIRPSPRNIQPNAPLQPREPTNKIKQE
jgi:hypothetical protein